MTTPPARSVLDPADPKTALLTGVKAALLALPGEFEFENPISGVAATDLFSLNTLLGAGIEVEVVRTLNKLREVWDPNNEWVGYRFERSSQSFPDVRLVRRDVGAPVTALGIELKGWWLLAKEGEPSLRYAVSPAACAEHDLVCVVPWHLSNAVAGVPRVTEPWIESARYAAEYRDYWWEHVRQSSYDQTVAYPPDAAPYPTKADLVSAVPAYDGGSNFGRLPRATGLMDDFLARSKAYDVLGIPVRDWISFLRVHSDAADADAVSASLEAALKRELKKKAPEVANEILTLTKRLGEIVP